MHPVWCGPCHIGRRSMWRSALTLYQLLVTTQSLWAQTDVPVAAVAPQHCSLECIRQGGPECEYCRVTADDIKKTLGFDSTHAFGDCIPWPCLELLGNEDPTICEHYVQAPTDLKVGFVHEPNPEYDTVVVSWKPSHYGIAFLRGFQVSVQALGGTASTCQLLLFNRNVSLSASHAQTIYKSDPFPDLSLGSQYVVTVMALPVPEQWDKFYQSLYFYTHSCAEKNGLEQCKQDWYPRHVEVQQEGSNITVTFNLAPPNLGIRRYFSFCYGDVKTKYTDIVPDFSKNKTHHSFQLSGLHEKKNYTCEIAAKEVDAVRKRFKIYVMGSQKDIPSSAHASLAVVPALCLAVAAIFGVLLAALMGWRSKMHRKKLDVNPEIITLHEETKTQKEVVILPEYRVTPPRLLICYSGHDGPAHVKAVMQLGAFIQQHMATQVCMDLWDSLSIAEEGSMTWYCRKIRESDFVLVICSPGHRQRHDTADPEVIHDDNLALMSNACSSDAIIQLIGAEVGLAKTRGEDLSKYMAAVFKYCKETDIPTELRLVSHYTFPQDLPLLFSHLHGVALHRPGGYLKINNITEEGFTTVPTGAALQLAIQEAGMMLSEKQHQTEDSSYCDRVDV
ncbi:interleukin-17 receptor D isoform X2 [Girardinichthys multiradiatus]|uniref:interleukin-17 receptor D isoform X2 n=1 Tax=Girardinichthys multiradiatus TaxID=208333 RepID=UPI001FAC3F16|nr:interleukin-17 receptor D isoform X2 [Girardinichthys multiradiatus]